MKYRNLRLYLVSILILLSIQAWGAGDTPAPYTLPNGMRVLVRERHSSPLVAIDLWVHAGAREEANGETGSAHFLEHTLFKGTTTRRAGDADIAIEDLGATLEAATGPDYAHFYTTVASAHLSAALAILADVVMNATLPDAEVEKERGVILDELAQHDADPTNRLIDLLYANAFRAHPYQRSPGGTQAAISARGRDTLAAFYRRCYQPQRCTLVIVGDCPIDRARTEATHAFGGWRSPDPSASNETADTVHTASRPSDQPTLDTVAAMTVHTEGAHGMVGIAFLTPAAHDVQMACMGLIAAALLGQTPHSGRLSGSPLSGSDAVARFTPRQDPSLFLLTASLPQGRASASEALKLEAALLNAVRGLLAQPPSAEEFAVAKRIVLGRLQFDTETDEGLARAIGYADIVGGDPPETLRLRIRQSTQADLQRFVQRYLDPAHRLSVHLLPTEDITRGAP